MRTWNQAPLINKIGFIIFAIAMVSFVFIGNT